MNFKTKGTSSIVVKRYLELLNAANKDDLESIEKTDGFVKLSNLPENVDILFKYSPSVFIFIENPKDPDGLGHWVLFTRLSDTHFEYFNSQIYWSRKGSSYLETPAEIRQLIERSFPYGGFNVITLSTDKPLQGKDSATCGLWCIMRMNMLRLPLDKWFDFVTETCEKSGYSPDHFVSMIIQPVIYEK